METVAGMSRRAAPKANPAVRSTQGSPGRRGKAASDAWPDARNDAGMTGLVDWSFPWYLPWRGIGEAVGQRVIAGAPLWQALNEPGRAPVRFVPQSDLSPALAYEQYVAQTGCCPTREGLHDFFNGLCWIGFPATKNRLNQLQAAQIARDGVQPVRGALRDALTVFDENAAFLSAPQPLWDALLARRWQELFVGLRPLWRDARLVLFGHALLEKLNTPRKPITAHVYRVSPASDNMYDLDRWVAQDLDPRKLACKPFAPLPVLGVPGWWPENSCQAFYEDRSVFRPERWAADAPQ